jgi:hypothetical protein
LKWDTPSEQLRGMGERNETEKFTGLAQILGQL